MKNTKTPTKIKFTIVDIVYEKKQRIIDYLCIIIKIPIFKDILQSTNILIHLI